MSIPKIIGVTITLVALSISLTIMTGPHSVNALLITPMLTVNPGSGPVDTAVSLAVTDYGPNSTISISIRNSYPGGPTGTVCSGRTNSTGGFGCRYVVPPPVRFNGCCLQFIASDAFGDLTNVVNFFVVAPSITINGSQYTQNVAVGTSLTFTAVDFAPNSSITIGSTCAGMTDASGSFSCTFVVPPTPCGTYLYFTGADGVGDSAYSPAVLITGCSFSVNPGSGPVYTAIALAVTGYAHNSTISVSISNSYPGGPSGQVCSGITNSSGSFGCRYVVPPPVRFNGCCLQFVASDSFGDSETTNFFVVAPSVTINGSQSTQNVAVGTSVTFNAMDFAPNSSITIGSACAGTTDASGSFNCTFVVPSTPCGSYLYFTGTDGVGDSAYSPALLVTGCSFAVNPRSGPVYTSVSLAVTGYKSNASISISISNSYPGGPSGTVCSGRTNSTGGFSCRYVVPPPVRFNGCCLQFVASDSFGDSETTNFFVVAPSVTINGSQSTQNVAVGGVVSFSATDFAPNSPIRIGTACFGTTNSSGNYNCTSVVPPATCGSYLYYTGTDGVGDSAYSPALYVQTCAIPYSTLTVSPASAPVGSSVTFVATGFASSSPISIIWPGGTACSGTTTTSSGLGGNFSCTFTIPPTPGGTFTFIARDTAGNIAATVFAVTPPSLADNPSSGPVGTSVRFNANGYASSLSISITWSGGTACSGTTDTTGSFSCTFSIPATPDGAYNFTGTDQAGNVATTTFKVTSFDFSLGNSPTDITVLRGGAASYTLTVTLNGGTAQSVTLSVVSGLPSGATVSFTTDPVAPTGSTTLNVFTSSTGDLGDFTLTISGIGGSKTHTATVNLHIYDFTLAVSPSSITVLRGGSATYNVTLSLQPGSSTTELPPVTLSVSGAPPDATQIFSPSTLVPSNTQVSSKLTIVTGSTSLGDFALTVTGCDTRSQEGGCRDVEGQAQHIFDYTTIINCPSSQVSGVPVVCTVQVILVPGSSTIGLPGIGLGLSGLPSGGSGTFAMPSGVPPFTTNVSITTPQGSTGQSSPTVTGTVPPTVGSTGGSHSTSATLNIFDFTVSVTPSDRTVERGGSTTYTVTISLTPGSSTTGLPSSLTLSLSGAPTDATSTLTRSTAFPQSSSSSTITTLNIVAGVVSLGDFALTATGNVTDNLRSGSANLHIYGVNVTCPTSGVTAGKPFYCTVSATGGTSPYSGTGTFSRTEPVKGTFNETFTVTDAKGVSASGIATVTVSPQSLVAEFSLAPSTATAGVPETFRASGTGGTTPYMFTWDFGDSGSGTGAIAGHTYASAGIYTVTLTTRDMNGAISTTSTSITVAVHVSLSKFFTRSEDPSNLLPVDSKGNPKVDIVFGAGVVRSTNPGQPRVWINATNIQGSPINSLTINETLPIDWLVDPPWIPGNGAIHVYFVYANKTLQDITSGATITTSTGNPQTVLASIANIPAATGGTSLLPGQAVYLAVKLSYGLDGTVQQANTYPRFYGDTARLSAWTMTGFTGIQSTNTYSAFFVAYPKVLGNVDGDYKVDIFDIATVAYAYGTHPGDALWNPNCDFLNLGVIDIQDVAIAAYYYGTSS